MRLISTSLQIQPVEEAMAEIITETSHSMIPMATASSMRMITALTVVPIGPRTLPLITTVTGAKIQLKIGMMIMMASLTKMTCVQRVH